MFLRGLGKELIKYMIKMNKFSKRSFENLKNIHPNLVAILVVGVKNCPIDFTITNGVRTTKEQQALYAKGRTEKGNIVTNADGIKNKSNHQIKDDGFGYAVDLYPYKNGSVQLNDIEGLKVIAKHLKSVAKDLGIDLYWGGDWKFKDYPHFSLING